MEETNLYEMAKEELIKEFGRSVGFSDGRAKSAEDILNLFDTWNKESVTKSDVLSNLRSFVSQWLKESLDGLNNSKIFMKELSDRSKGVRE